MVIIAFPPQTFSTIIQAFYEFSRPSKAGRVYERQFWGQMGKNKC